MSRIFWQMNLNSWRKRSESFWKWSFGKINDFQMFPRHLLSWIYTLICLSDILSSSSSLWNLQWEGRLYLQQRGEDGKKVDLQRRQYWECTDSPPSPHCQCFCLNPGWHKLLQADKRLVRTNRIYEDQEVSQGRVSSEGLSPSSVDVSTSRILMHCFFLLQKC